ncbi:MAG: 4Fe-4S dicluster domain-containing protein [Deltaproteobacteria bacterium]|nr:4Fe-4S dicluster domain-containing protein [Deltaproteobacteria bacterium]MBW1918724.1 4Fe-4S dicluster domain-containing protein [Deltaproteobacteria bacterium]MBW1934511.1 4Fe-4S dicluster domain-containing protein [Deltaproteobacteria bacterium]MBW1977109.1 4Fe-4S dicluster domain-containing protein [Deltaproteobacteria bacterium]MBW2045500.1 4Fe-4S dicluster domain-containing protein [Deltaproteobacteria bacterium]
MITRPFLGLGKPRLNYPPIEMLKAGSLAEVALPSRIVLLVRGAYAENGNLLVKVGDRVKTGERLILTEDKQDYFISTATGLISNISSYTGYLEEPYTSISIDAEGEEQWDGEFERSGPSMSRREALRFFKSLPGEPVFASLINKEPPLEALVVNCTDKDLLVTTNQSILKSEFESLKQGVEILRAISGIKRVVVLVPEGMDVQIEAEDVYVIEIKPVYPATLPKMVVKNVFGREVPAGETCEAVGLGFINAEAVVALALAYKSRRLPVDKVITLIKKDGSCLNLKARIGTPAKDILNAFGIELAHGDRLIFGGPMTGEAIYSEDTPISYGTDAIMVQDREHIVRSSDLQCVNCGECVRACPAKVPVNMLVRLLQNGLYEEAASRYDLLSCIECGLCSYVCIARIPLFHYIMLGKYEFAKIKSAEEVNVESEATD